MTTSSLLIADIGGTHARFALISDVNPESGDFQIDQEAKFRCVDYENFDQALDTYLESLGRPHLDHASIAIAGPVRSDVIRMTNLPWEFSVTGLKRRLRLKSLRVINDAAAGALATIHLQTGDLELIRAGAAIPGMARVNVIPGTGLGVAAAIPSDHGWLPIASEGGHIGLSPRSAEEYEMFRLLNNEQLPVTGERLLSGPGMLLLYQTLARIRDVRVLDLDPAELTRLALEDKDPLCVDAVNTYCNMLGTLAGDFALVFGAHGGIYLSGNILRKLEPVLRRGDFNTRFVDKGPMGDGLANIPIHLVTRDHPGLWGAASWLITLLSRRDSGWNKIKDDLTINH